jgi:hypothetical protein
LQQHVAQTIVVHGRIVLGSSNASPSMIDAKVGT